MTARSSQPWFATFFTGLANRFWADAVDVDQTAEECAWMEAALDVPEGAPLLDLACGRGRHAIPFARAGYAVTAVDLSAEELAEGQAEAEDLPITWLAADMRRLPADLRVAGAWCFGNSFGYLPREGTREMLAGLGRAVRQGGRLLIDTAYVAEAILPNLEGRYWQEAGGVLCAIENDYDVATSTLTCRYLFTAGGRSERKDMRCCVYTVAELTALLDAAGFVVERLHGDCDGRPFELGDSRLLLAARRR